VAAIPVQPAGSVAGASKRRSPASRPAGTAGGAAGGVAGRVPAAPSSGGRTVTATWIGRPSRRDSASVIEGRSRDSMTSRVNASGTDTSAVSSTIARSRVSRRYARCCGETISSVTADHTAPRSVASLTVRHPHPLVAVCPPRPPTKRRRYSFVPTRRPQVVHNLCINASRAADGPF
jgi:hypothetical protein